MKAKYDFSGKSALVIGGTTGIGRAAALAFADAGANLFVAGLGAAVGQDLKDEINKRFPAVAIEFAEVDVRSEDGVRTLHEAAYKRFGRIDTAFNNAGVPGRTAPIHELSQADYDLIMDVNLRGIFFGMKHQIPHMLEQGGGTIVNTSSLFGVMATPPRQPIAPANGA